ncbi:hypothetical protein KJ840_04380 [Patescibacteria group bacterium]|nr:hypothetical protein [Patescibacteria group bacterium]
MCTDDEVTNGEAIKVKVKFIETPPDVLRFPTNPPGLIKRSEESTDGGDYPRAGDVYEAVLIKTIQRYKIPGLGDWPADCLEEVL